MKLQGKNVVITGASFGLGHALAQAALHEGANLLLCARDGAALEIAGLALREAAPPGQRVHWQACDVSDEQQVESLADRGRRELGGCDVLINNAGIQGAIGPFDKIPWAEWKKTIEIDLFGVALVTRAFLPLLKQHGGKIINLSGGGATAPRPFYSAYSAAKTAVVRLTETLSGELLDNGIDVNAVAPGPLHTRLTAESLIALGGANQTASKDYSEALETSKRDEDFAEAIALCLFLASADSNGITGKLVSAKWDKWRELKAPLPVDLYTLRRTLPEQST
jgi:NAD(P)-dependent dehydrogenase (short-subunit alcohol dehydrogenase family)